MSEPKHQRLEVVFIAAVVVALVAAWVTRTETGRELLFRAGLIHAEPMTGLK